MVPKGKNHILRPENDTAAFYFLKKKRKKKTHTNLRAPDEGRNPNAHSSLSVFFTAQYFFYKQ